MLSFPSHDGNFACKMDCCRWILSPCICLCPCLEDNEYLLPGRSRRATLSVSTHDDDWDADVGFESDPKRSNSKMTKANATMNSEMQLQMQQLSRNAPRSMQNVMVTEDDESIHAGTSTTNSTSWNGYTATADMDRDDSSHNLSPKTNAEKGNISKNNSSTNLGRSPYRDVPYTDNATTNTSAKNNEIVAPQNVNVSVGDDDSDEEVEISLL